MTNDELAQKILNDIKNINEKRGKVLEKLTHHDITSESNDQIQTVFNFLRDNDFSYILSSQNILFLNTIEKLIEPLSITVNTIVNSISLTATNMKNFMNYVNQIKDNLDKLEQKSSPNNDPKSILQHLEEINNGKSQKDAHMIKIQEQLNELENITKPINELIKNSEETSDLKKELNDIKESISDLQGSNAQIEITKMLTQANQLFEKASNSEQLVNDEVQKLLQAKEGQVANTLSQQFKEKTDSLKRPIWINFTLIFILVIGLSLLGLKYVDLLLNPNITNEVYWHSLVMVLLIKLPLIFLILFVLNEYTKAKKLFEEYEHKRIMAATLVNNLERLKQELHADEKDLLELIKTPFEKIFDNPVHSIYGDKSGDKGFALDDLDKITSIIEKLKPKTP